jgi:hypothetical protein
MSFLGYETVSFGECPDVSNDNGTSIFKAFTIKEP